MLFRSVNNYECLLKRMLYCPGSRQEMLSALEADARVTPNAGNNSCPLPGQVNTIFFLTNIHNYLHFNGFVIPTHYLNYHSFHPSKTVVWAVESS